MQGRQPLRGLALHTSAQQSLLTMCCRSHGMLSVVLNKWSTIHKEVCERVQLQQTVKCQGWQNLQFGIHSSMPRLSPPRLPAPICQTNGNTRHRGCRIGKPDCDFLLTLCWVVNSFKLTPARSVYPDINKEQDGTKRHSNRSGLGFSNAMFLIPLKAGRCMVLGLQAESRWVLELSICQLVAPFGIKTNKPFKQ